MTAAILHAAAVCAAFLVAMAIPVRHMSIRSKRPRRGRHRAGESR